MIQVLSWVRVNGSDLLGIRMPVGMRMLVRIVRPPRRKQVSTRPSPVVVRIRRSTGLLFGHTVRVDTVLQSSMI